MNHPRTLLFGIHCHQPYGNFSHVVESACDQSYEPFLECCSQFPDFRFAVHYSGWLLEWIKEHRHGLFRLLQIMAGRGQIEFFTGGYYEPVLPSIPHRDRVGQIKMLSRFIQQHFGQRPRGLWLTERVWDSSLVPSLVEAGVEYVMLDDYHMLCTGLYSEADRIPSGYMLTEEDGNQLGMFFISEQLRYQIPFASPARALETLRNRDARPGEQALGCFFDDGEKFGVWPGTHDWVYGERDWLRDFLTRLDEAEDICTGTYAEYFDQHAPAGLCYLPSASYHEMGEWSQDPARWQQQRVIESVAEPKPAPAILRGGIWKNFLVRYSEANAIHKKMLRLSRLPLGLEAREALFAGQCNDVLWHGVFGGLYLPNLRYNAYQALNHCEKLAGRRGVFCSDFDWDGHQDILVRQTEYFAQVSAGCGGQLVEFSLMSSEVNLLNCLMRRPEAYHRNLLKSEDALVSDDSPEQEPSASVLAERQGENPHGAEPLDELPSIHDEREGEDADMLREHLVYDWYRRTAFITHFMAAEPDPERLRRADLAEQGDFANQPFELVEYSADSCTLRRIGGIFEWDRALAQVELVYKYRFLGRRVILEVQVRNRSDAHVGSWLGMEMNLHLPSDGEILVAERTLAKDAEECINDCSLVRVRDACLDQQVEVRACTGRNLLVAPIRTLSQSEAGMDLTYQASALLWYQWLDLPAAAVYKCSFMLSIEER